VRSYLLVILMLTLSSLPFTEVEPRVKGRTVCNEMPAIVDGAYYNRSNSRRGYTMYQYRKVLNWSYGGDEIAVEFLMTTTKIYPDGTKKVNNRTKHMEDEYESGTWMGYWYNPQMLPGIVKDRFGSTYADYRFQNISFTFKGKERKALNASALSNTNPDGKKEYRELIISWDYGFVFKEKIKAVSNSTTLSTAMADTRQVTHKNKLIDTNRFELAQEEPENDTEPEPNNNTTEPRPELEQPEKPSLLERYWYLIPITLTSILIAAIVYWKKKLHSPG